jgi:hypothetical protein
MRWLSLLLLAVPAWTCQCVSCRDVEPVVIRDQPFRRGA